MQTLNLKQNYFELFGLDPGFEIDIGKLTAEQKRLQGIYHPDRFVSASDQDRRLSVQQASWVNEAGMTLANPVKRARYLLKLAGMEMNDESETTSDIPFLMEQIELREAIDNCRNSPDPLQHCDQISAQLAARAAEISLQFVNSYEAGDFESARLHSRKMQFLQRIQEQLTDLQYALEDELI